jgi:hypothetical protein
MKCLLRWDESRKAACAVVIASAQQGMCHAAPWLLRIFSSPSAFVRRCVLCNLPNTCANKLQNVRRHVSLAALRMCGAAWINRRTGNEAFNINTRTRADHYCTAQICRTLRLRCA